jgi:hypothetical protein
MVEDLLDEVGRVEGVRASVRTLPGVRHRLDDRARLSAFSTARRPVRFSLGILEGEVGPEVPNREPVAPYEVRNQSLRHVMRYAVNVSPLPRLGELAPDHVTGQGPRLGVNPGQRLRVVGRQPVRLKVFEPGLFSCRGLLLGALGLFVARESFLEVLLRGFVVNDNPLGVHKPRSGKAPPLPKHLQRRFN